MKEGAPVPLKTGHELRDNRKKTGSHHGAQAVVKQALRIYHKGPGPKGHTREVLRKLRFSFQCAQEGHC